MSNPLEVNLDRFSQGLADRQELPYNDEIEFDGASIRCWIDTHIEEFGSVPTVDDVAEEFDLDFEHDEEIHSILEEYQEEEIEHGKTA